MQQFLQEDIEGHRPVYKSLVDNSNELLNSCDSASVTNGVPEIKAETEDAVQRWTALNDFYRNRKDQVSEADNKVKKYRTLVVPLENSYKKAAKSLEESHHEGIDVEESKKMLQAMKVMVLNNQLRKVLAIQLCGLICHILSGGIPLYIILSLYLYCHFPMPSYLRVIYPLRKASIISIFLKVLQENVQILETDVQNVGEQVKKEDYPNVNFTPVKQRVKKLSNRVAALRRNVSVHITWLEKVVEEIIIFVNSTDELQKYVNVAFVQLDNFKPISNDHKVLSKQLEEVKELEKNTNEQFVILSDADITARSITSMKKDDPKAVKDVAERINSCEAALVELKEKIKDRKQKILRAQEHISLYRAQLEPVEKAFSEIEDSAVMEAPVSEEELGKVEVSADDDYIDDNDDDINVMIIIIYLIRINSR